jgi:hypothetical protein
MARLFAILGDNTPDLLTLALADCLSYRNVTKKMKLALPFNKQAPVIDSILSRYFQRQAEPPLPKIIDGNTIMSRFKLKPGPEIGRLLKIISQAQVIGAITSTKEALALAKKNL